MAGLIEKKLSKLPIGTMVELAYEEGDDTLQICGIITDNDFTANVQVTDASSEEVILDYSIVRRLKVTQTLKETLAGLQPGTKVRFSHGDEENTQPELSGTVTDNDHTSDIEIRLSSGEELILSYSIIRSLLVSSKTAPTPAPAPKPVPKEQPAPEPQPIQPPAPKKEYLQDMTPMNLLTMSDNDLKDLFDILPREDRQYLSGAFDSFRYGVKIGDKEKQAAAAAQARQILLREADKDYYWDENSVRFCACLMRRTNLYDFEVPLVGECFPEAAYSCYFEKKYPFCAAYAARALLDHPEPELAQNLKILLCIGLVRGEDASGMSLLAGKLPDAMLQEVLESVFAAKGTKPEGADVAQNLSLLEKMLPGTETGEELRYWMPEEPAPKPVVKPLAVPMAPQPAPKPELAPTRYGWISRLNWSEKGGVITDEEGKTWNFGYGDILSTPLLDALKACFKADLDGKIYNVSFVARGGAAREVRQDFSLWERAGKILLDKTREDRYHRAFALYRRGLHTEDYRQIMVGMVKAGSAISEDPESLSLVNEALAAYDQKPDLFPMGNPFNLMDLIRCYVAVKNYPKMLELIRRAMTMDLTGRQLGSYAGGLLNLLRGHYEICGDRKLATQMMEYITSLEDKHAGEFRADEIARTNFRQAVQHHKVWASCILDAPEDAQRYFDDGVAGSKYADQLLELIDKTRQRLNPQPEPQSEPEEPVPALEMLDFFNLVSIEQIQDEPEEEEEEILPYVDAEGFAALNLSKRQVVDYALSITGANRIGAILAYLRAGASLNPELRGVYGSVALAVNDPMEAPDYSVDALLEALAGDPDYPELTRICMACAYLRTSFVAGRGYDYSAQGLRESISLIREMPELTAVCDTLEQFRRETDAAIDIYADYRHQDAHRLHEEQAQVVRHAQELYDKFVAKPAREGAKFARLLETKKIVFAKDGLLATMLRAMIERDHSAMDARKQEFAARFLIGGKVFSDRHISAQAIDDMVADAWEQANKAMAVKKNTATLQGDRRNNLRSSISDILSTVCRWYDLAEQSAGLNWRTDAGAKVYQNMRPRLIEQLTDLARACRSVGEPQPDTGMFLLQHTAWELIARLDGSWQFAQEKSLYIDFLRSNHVMLDENFLPDLSSTFCALKDFNILARIRAHVEGEKLSFGQVIERIYGMDKTWNNYGAAERILTYLQALGQEDTVTIPQEPEKFVTYTAKQNEIRLRSFRETYALAMNYGQIIKTDAFCYTLEETVRYWFDRCRSSGNYGFFTAIVTQAEEQIHKSARVYEQQLEDQLDALIQGNKDPFAEHPGYADAIRGQIEKQNFIVAEDWMHRIRLGDFSLDVQQPEALEHLARFWNSYVITYDRVADAGRTLGSLLGHREVRNKDARRAEQLIENWLNTGHPSNPEKITQLLNLLGWSHRKVVRRSLPTDPKAEIYEASPLESSDDIAAPQHPIAAFGSELRSKPMYVSCLYGTYDCDRIFEKIRLLDGIDGSKIILLDYALGQADRRALARKLKKRESGLRNVYLVIDRVLITYLAANYNENLINRILMATAVPFTYCQPYVVESSLTMPPEIFIGRKDELLKIEQSDGVNLIYGGRQLGKSALFKKALADIDGRNRQRAVLIDISERTCAEAAQKVSAKLIDLGITPDAQVTDDWDVLCRTIEQRLRSKEDPISYFLLMLDEADTFISDCADCGYRPLVALKDVQQSLPGKFKYVLAGLHNLVKFNRQVALGNNSVITHMPSLKITPFRTPEAQELLTMPLSYLGFSLPSKVTVSQILATVNYFPGLIQLYCRKLIESIRAADYAGYDVKKTPPYIVTDDHLRRIMADKEFVDQIHQKFEMTLTLDQKQGSYYYPLTLLIGWMYTDVPSKSGYCAKDICLHAKDLGVYPLAELAEEKIDALLQELQDLNILRSVSNGYYLLASKNFRDLLGTADEILEKLTKVGVAQ